MLSVKAYELREKSKQELLQQLDELKGELLTVRAAPLRAHLRGTRLHA